MENRLAEVVDKTVIVEHMQVSSPIITLLEVKYLLINIM